MSCSQDTPLLPLGCSEAVGEVMMRRRWIRKQKVGELKRLIRFPEVLRRVPYSKATLYRKIAEGKFPKQIKLDANGRAVAFLESEVDAWIEELVEAAGIASTAA